MRGQAKNCVHCRVFVDVKSKEVRRGDGERQVTTKRPPDRLYADCIETGHPTPSSLRKCVVKKATGHHR